MVAGSSNVAVTYENMLSNVIKSIERYVMDALKREKIDKFFICYDLAQIVSKICGISRKQDFTSKKGLLLL